jgi:hypothetical protein
MKIQDFLAHHRIQKNPFSEEDAQTDPVFKDYCIKSTYHPAWDKIYGNPGDPSTSIVLGEKGSGKTALRLQMQQHIEQYNRDNPHARCFVISYDDFNPFLDYFRGRIKRYRAPEKVLGEFQLWDHIDAILSLAVTDLVDGLFRSRSRKGEQDDPNAIPADFRKRLTRHQRRDLLLLTACYDNSLGAPQAQRWRRLRTRLHAWRLRTWWAFLIGFVVTTALVTAAGYFWWSEPAPAPTSGDAVVAEVESTEEPAARVPVAEDAVAEADSESMPSGVANTRKAWVTDWWWAYLVVALVCWLPWLLRSAERWFTAASIHRHIRVFGREIMVLARELANMTASDLSGQPLPNKNRTDDRYRLLSKLQFILESLDFAGITVLLDRVDEPHLINGSAEAMRAMLWPLLDNKFLKQEGIGIKILLPKELSRFIDREDSDFYQRARLDKQNMVPSLDWSGEALYDLANARLAACSDREDPPRLMELFDETVTEGRVYEGLRALRVPRHAFRFIHRLLVAHCNRHTDADPSWRVSSDTLEAELAVYRRDQEAADRGLGSG